MLRPFVSALVNNTSGKKISIRFNNKTWLCFSQLKWQNQKWCSHLTVTNLSMVTAEALVMSINVVTVMHSSLMCSFKTDTVVHGIQLLNVTVVLSAYILEHLLFCLHKS